MSLPADLVDKLMLESWKLLQQRVCRSYRNTQRGSGSGGVLSRCKGHHVYPLQSFVTTAAERAAGSEKKSGCKSRPVSIKLVTPAAAAVTQAKKELEYIKEEEPGSDAQKRSKQQNRIIRTRAKRAGSAGSRKPSPLFEKRKR